MSHKFLSFVLMGGLTVGGCATPYSTVATRHADTEEYRQYREFSSPAGYTTAPTTERVDALDRAIREVADAPDIDAAIDAYSFGLTLDRSSVKLHKTYLRRMVDLGAPHLASGAATKVVDAEPDAALARAVLAYSAGRDGLMVDALTDISIAAKRAPDDPFIQRTSGHLLAWYDNNPRPPGLPSTVRFALQAMHETFDDKRVFADAYNDAADYYHDRQVAMARGPTTGPSRRLRSTSPTAPHTARITMSHTPSLPRFTIGARASSSAPPSSWTSRISTTAMTAISIVAMIAIAIGITAAPATVAAWPVAERAAWEPPAPAAGISPSWADPVFFSRRPPARAASARPRDASPGSPRLPSPAGSTG
jgi:hypothetical protein